MNIRIFAITIVFLVCTLITIPVYAAGNDNIIVSPFKDPVTVRFAFQIPVFLVSIKPFTGGNETKSEEKAKEDAHITYMPDLRLSGGIGLYYNNYGFSYVSKITDIPTANGQSITDYTDIRLNEYSRKFGADLVYMNYKGFSLTNSNEHGYSDND